MSPQHVSLDHAMRDALQHHHAGRLAEAELIYRQILASQPQHADALHLLGLISHQFGRNEIARDLIRQAIAIKPGDSAFHNNLGEALRALRRFTEAIDAYGAALALKPDHPEAWSNLGIVLCEQGRIDEAIEAHARAIHSKPAYAKAHNNLGNALKDKGDFDAAIASYRKAIEFKPDYANAHNNLGVVLTKLERLEEAVASYQTSLSLKFDVAETHNNLGGALIELGKTDDAVAAYVAAIRLKPDYAHAHNNLGLALMKQGKLDEAIAAFARALRFQPPGANREDAEMENNLGNARKDQGRLDEALACYRQAMTLDPSNTGYASNRVYAMHFHPGFDAVAILAEQRAWDDRNARPLKAQARPHPNDKSPDRRLRVGYVSPDLRDHVVGRNLLPLLREHDHTKFEAICYGDVPRPDELTRRFRSCADASRDTAGVADEKLAAQIRDDRIDILVDCSLHMAHNRLMVFARKPAPVQVTFVGYPGGTGLSTMDYRLSDPHLDPPGASDADYVEQTIRLPDTFWCYDPAAMSIGLAIEPPVNSLPAAQSGFITFGCLNNFCKVNDQVLALWAQVLAAVKASRILLSAAEGHHRQQLQDRLERDGIDPNRIQFVVPGPRARYLAHYHRIDIGLDTFPYNGHTTSLDSLWMGVPVVTLVGQTVVGRAGLSQLSNLGLTDLVATTLRQYVQIATALAGDLPRLAALRAGLRERMLKSPLTDAPRFARAVEAAYRTMWQQWCATATSEAAR